MRFVLLFFLTGWLGASGPLSPELLWSMKRVSGPALSPDGKSIALVVTEYDVAENKGRSALWLVPVDGSAARKLTEGTKRDHTPMWAPDGKTLYFCSSRSGSTQIYALDPAKGEPAAAVTAFDFSVGNAFLAADGKRFVFTKDVALDSSTADLFPDLPQASGRIFDQLMYRHWDSWSDGTYSHVLTCDLKGQNPVDWMKDQKVDSPLKPFGGSEQITTAPDGGLVYTAKISDFPADSTDSDLYWVNANGTRNLTEGMDGYDINPQFSPDGKTLAFLSMKTPGYEADRNRLMLMDVASGKLSEWQTGWDITINDFQWSADGKSVLFTAPYQGNVVLFQMVRGAQKAELICPFNGNINAVMRKGKETYALLSTHLRPNELYRWSASQKAWQMISHFNDELYKDLDLPSYEAKWFEASDGQKIHNWIFYPPHFDPNQKYPLLIYCQGGPQSMISQSFSFRWNFHIMAAQGYVVCAVNRRGLPGFGQKWNDDIAQDWGGQAMRDLLASTDAMQAMPFIDKARTGVVGASFGGYAVYWMMGHNSEPKRFATMIAHAGLYNLESMAASTEELFFVHHDLGGQPWQSEALKQAYAAHSPHEFANNWDTPLLVVHGERDYRVPVAQGMQAFTTAQLKGLKSRFLYFPDEGHWVLKPQNGILWQRVFFGWLSDTLK
ncbi:MAG: S9 family peptidase [Acidobacteria bacterium]|nr:S9 family peptidase [Acidobacteriota bacterium]MCB9396713.1 S9 family peptidase [Acidobacteriota bacterium]